MGFFFVLLVIAAIGLGYVFRVQLLSKVLGQSESRVRGQLERRKRR